MLGKSVKEIALNLGWKPHTVGKYIRVYYAHGIEAFKPKLQPGQPRQITPVCGRINGHTIATQKYTISQVD